jgi:transposase InsO family protein
MGSAEKETRMKTTYRQTLIAVGHAGQKRGDPISENMAGGRAYDNIFIERLWRTVKYEEVYLHDYRNVSEARLRIASYIQFYNTERPHEGLGYRTPYEVYSGQLFNPQHMQAPSELHLKQAHYLS